MEIYNFFLPFFYFTAIIQCEMCVLCVRFVYLGHFLDCLGDMCMAKSLWSTELPCFMIFLYFLICGAVSLIFTVIKLKLLAHYFLMIKIISKKSHYNTRVNHFSIEKSVQDDTLKSCI